MLGTSGARFDGQNQELSNNLVLAHADLMKMDSHINNFKRHILWLIAATMAFSGVVLANPSETFVNQDILPFGFAMTSLQGNKEVDPHKPITLEAVGLGVRLAKVNLLDETGKTLFEAKDQTKLTLPAPLAFGTRHTLKVTAVRFWTGQTETREVSFRTVSVPTLEGPAHRMLEPDASVTLHFDRPVSEVQVQTTGSLTFTAQPDTTGQNIRLLASAYVQDQSYSVKLNYKTSKGVPLPPLILELSTAPPLVAETNVRGLTNLGLMLPLQMTFSEPLADRDNVSSYLKVQTRDGNAINGKWSWTGQRQLRFTPQPSWPASSDIEVTADVKKLRSERGGTLKQNAIAQFSTGLDRRLFVYLDSQSMEAVENGKVIRTFKVSTGKSKTPTVTGAYYIYDRYRHKTMRSDVAKGQPGYYEVKDVPYTQFFHKDFAIHGAYWHNNFGNPASHGCVNMATKDKNKRWPKVSEDAGWLYQWGALGLPVTVLKQAPQTIEADHQPVKDDKTPDKKSAAIPSKITELGVLKENHAVNQSSSEIKKTVNIPSTKPAF